MAVAMNFGLEEAMRVNRAAIQDAARVEARRLRTRLELPDISSVTDYLLFQETAISLLGPELLDYTVSLTGEDEFDIRVDRCFAFDNVSRAGIADQYECGIMPRLLGWLEGLGIDHQITPEPGSCLKARGAECRYAITLYVPEAGEPSDTYSPTDAQKEGDNQ
jgi:hypothetical protein